MSLETRIIAFVSAVAADIKALFTANALRVYRSDGTRTYIPLDSRGELRVHLQDGAAAALPVIGVIYG